MFYLCSPGRFSRLMTAKPERIANITRVTVRSMSNQNLNRTESQYTPDNRARSGSSIFGSVNSHVMVTPINSSHCQLIASRHSSMDPQIDLKLSETIRSNEQLADALCRRSHEPVTWINRGLYCGHCRPVYFQMVPIRHLEHSLPLSLPRRTQRSEKESPKSPKQSPTIEDASEALLTPYSGLSISCFYPHGQLE